MNCIYNVSYLKAKRKMKLTKIFKRKLDMERSNEIRNECSIKTYDNNVINIGQNNSQRA